MRVLTKLGIYFYTIIIVVIGVSMISLAAGLINTYEIAAFIHTFNIANIRLIIAFGGMLLILVSLLFSQIIFTKIKREKTIAFQTPNGEVLVSLSAVEDLIRRTTIEMEGIKDARPDVIAGKKGIEINLRLILNDEINIPEFTARIQDIIKNRIQEMLGIDEAIVIKIFVAKIVTREIKSRKKKEIEPDETPIPFQGYKR